MSTTPLLDAAAVRALAETSAGADPGCTCAAFAYPGWETLPPSFPQAQMRHCGSLRDPEAPEPTVREYHPAGTRLWSPDAPIALRHFPANRADVLQCTRCQRAFLQYLEVGGYYIEPRLRLLDPRLVVDAPVEA